MIQVARKSIEQPACIINSSYEAINLKPDESIFQKLYSFKDRELKGKINRQWIINKYYQTSKSISQRCIHEITMSKIANKVINNYLPKIIENIDQGNTEQGIRIADKMLDDCIATINANIN